MKLVRYESVEGVHWGELEDGVIRRLTGMTGRRSDLQTSLADVTLLAPCEPKVIVCVGKNYLGHVREMGGAGASRPEEPGLFLKGINALIGPEDPVPYPAWTEELHYEGELALVIAHRMRRVSEEQALSHVLGFTCACDITARDKQRSDLQWTRAKSADGFCPVGPWLETELEPAGLELRTHVNGEPRQHGNTRDLIFDVPALLSYISSFMTLEAGDLVLTGTPEGVGPLVVGDEVEVTISGIGSLKNTVEAD